MPERTTWVCFPTAKPPDKIEAALKPWKERGWRTSIWTDPATNPTFGVEEKSLGGGSHFWIDGIADLHFHGVYFGYVNSANSLGWKLSYGNGASVVRFTPADWVLFAGDDMLPPAQPPAELAHQCREHFKGTFGVMQGTGDRWMIDASGRPASERICGSPMAGADFIRRWNGGRGVFWREYNHFFADEEMKNVTETHGILWRRPDVMIEHNHWSKVGAPRPDYMNKAHAKWGHDEEIFRRRQAEGFPGHEPVTA